jgi:hypothetical protein
MDQMYRRLARFNKQAPTGVKNPFVIFNPHTLTPCSTQDPNFITSTIIDPGIKNCAIRVAKYSLQTGKSQTLMMQNFNFTRVEAMASTGNYGLETQYYPQVLTTLDPYLELFCQSQYIGIESQLPINYDLVRMGQHLISYFMIRVRDQGNRPLIIEIDPHLKSRMLNAPPRMKKPELKSWAHTMGIHFLRYSDEHSLADQLSQTTKGDDMGDIICYEKCLILLLTQGICRPPMPSGP